MTRAPRRLTVNLPAVLAAGVEQLRPGRRAHHARVVARILASAVRSLKPPQQEDRTP